jgi:hypothetical protein
MVKAVYAISNSGDNYRANIPSSFFNSFRSHNSPEVSTVGRHCDCYELMYDDLNHRKHGKVFKGSPSRIKLQ